MKSWRTTVIGVMILVSSVLSVGIALLDGDPGTTPNYEAILIAFGGLGFLVAKDHSG